MKIERIWAMPSPWTFTIKPIAALLKNEVVLTEYWVDPFAGKNSPANVTNDLNPKLDTDYHLEAIEFLKLIPTETVDGVLFDPPYSMRQVKECYEGIGSTVPAESTRMDFWSKCKNEIARILKPSGKVISFGWNSMGLGKGRGFEIQSILLVPHGGSRNDTICVVEIKK